MRGLRGPRTTSNFCSTLTISRPAKIFYVILNKTKYNKIATWFFLCAIDFPCRTPLSTILGWGLRGPGQLWMSTSLRWSMVMSRLFPPLNRKNLILTSMSIGVYFHVYFLMESFSTIATNIRLVVCVCSHVSVKVGGSIERLVTSRAHIRLNWNT